MRFQRIISVVMGEPWCITEAGHAAVRALVEKKTAGVAMDLSDFVNEPDQARIENGVGIIPIKGVIGKGLGKLEKSCGACDLMDVEAAVQAFAVDGSVYRILLDVDSPGGVVGGVPELADLIAQVDKTKKVTAFTEGQMCSAAYWLAAGAREIIATPSAEVGSIGVYMPWMDSTAAFAAQGLKVEVIKNTGGTYKGMGMPGTSLTDDQRAHLQSRVDEIFGMFTDHVTTHRTAGAEAMRGQTFMGKSAKKAGLVDRVGNYSTLIS